MIDLAFLLYYAVDVSHFEVEEDASITFEKQMIEVYYRGLLRHGGLRGMIKKLTLDHCYSLFE